MKTTTRIAVAAVAILIAAAATYWLLQTPAPAPQQTTSAKAQSDNAALGQIANPEDKPIIQAVLDDPEAGFLVKKAAETAIKNFK